jgi:hypothetical protein
MRTGFCSFFISFRDILAQGADYCYAYILATMVPFVRVSMINFETRDSAPYFHV